MNEQRMLDCLAWPIEKIPETVHDQLNEDVRAVFKLADVVWFYSLEWLAWHLRLRVGTFTAESRVDDSGLQTAEQAQFHAAELWRQIRLTRDAG